MKLLGLSYTKKCYGLFAAFIVFLLLAYKISFSHTVLLAGEIRAKEEKIRRLGEMEKELPFLKAKMALIEKVYTANDSLSLRDRLTAFISDFSFNNHCVVTEIPHVIAFKKNNISVETNAFTVQGNFKNLLCLEHALENKFSILAKIMSVRFFSLRDLQTKRKNLFVTLVTQSFNQNRNK